MKYNNNNSKKTTKAMIDFIQILSFLSDQLVTLWSLLVASDWEPNKHTLLFFFQPLI